MAKARVTTQDFLKNMEIEEVPVASPAPARAASRAKLGAPAATTEVPRRTRELGQNGLKHLGGYVGKETAEQFALLKLRLGLDNSNLIVRAIDDLFRREIAAQQFGDR